MNKEDIQSVFEQCGLGTLGDELAFKLWIKGFGDKTDEDSLEEFLLAYEINENHSMLVDEFLYHFQNFSTVLKRFDGVFPPSYM